MDVLTAVLLILLAIAGRFEVARQVGSFRVFRRSAIHASAPSRYPDERRSRPRRSASSSQASHHASAVSDGMP